MLVRAAQRIEDAVTQVVGGGLRTPDLGGTATTRELTAALAEAVATPPA